MKREHIVSTAITDEEHKTLNKMIAERMLAGDKASVSIILREALSKYIANGKPDDKQVDNPTTPAKESTQDPTETPTENTSNPFADLSFD